MNADERGFNSRQDLGPVQFHTLQSVEFAQFVLSARGGDGELIEARLHSIPPLLVRLLMLPLLPFAQTTERLTADERAHLAATTKWSDAIGSLSSSTGGEGRAFAEPKRLRPRRR